MYVNGLPVAGDGQLLSPDEAGEAAVYRPFTFSQAVSIPADSYTIAFVPVSAGTGSHTAPSGEVCAIVDCRSARDMTADSATGNRDIVLGEVCGLVDCRSAADRQQRFVASGDITLEAGHRYTLAIFRSADGDGLDLMLVDEHASTAVGS